MKKIKVLSILVYLSFSLLGFSVSQNAKVKFAKFKYNYVRGLYLYEATPEFFLKLEKNRLEGNLKNAVMLLRRKFKVERLSRHLQGNRLIDPAQEEPLEEEVPLKGSREKNIRLIQEYKYLIEQYATKFSYPTVERIINSDKAFKEALLYMKSVENKRGGSSGELVNKINNATMLLLDYLKRETDESYYSEDFFQEQYAAEISYLKNQMNS